MFDNPDFFCADSQSAPTEFNDYAFNATVAINHPAEPVLVFYEDGGFEWMFDGDVAFVSEANLGTDREVVNAVTIESVLAGLHDFIQRNPVSAR